MENTRLNNEEALRQMFITSTFGISPIEWKAANDSKDKDVLASIARKCAERAYRDYNRTLKFRENVSHKDFPEALCNITLEQVDDLISEGKKGQREFDKQHKIACDAIKETANAKNVLKENAPFSYGQAQKQLNMTLKYMWLLGLWDLNSITDKLHVTVDNYIIKAVWKINKIYLPLSEGKKRSGTYYSDKLEHVWSRWEDDTYIPFQKSLRENIALLKTDAKPNYTYHCVFEWELDAWNEIATSNKKSGKTAQKK